MSTPASAGVIPDFVREDLDRLELALPEAVLVELGRYLDLLLEANQRMNLTAIRDRDEAWRRHIIDSLTVLPGLADLPGEGGRGRVVDVGSGGGLPGIPLAIARPDVAVTLLEATGKKVKFLESCVAELGLTNVNVVQGRAETAGQQAEHRQQYDIAVCRAVGRMVELLEYTLPLVKVGGQVLAMKGPRVEDELDEAGDALSVLGAGDIHLIDAYPEDFGVHTIIVTIAKARPTPRKYPRAPGTPKHAPIGSE